jgi:hypothetical protein
MVGDKVKLYLYWNAWDDELELVFAESPEDRNQILKDKGLGSPETGWKEIEIKHGRVEFLYVRPFCRFRD